MLIRRIARPMLAATFIARGVDALRSPKPAADAARPTLEGLSKLPDPVGTEHPDQRRDRREGDGRGSDRRGPTAGHRAAAPVRLRRAGIQRRSGKPWRTRILERIDPERKAAERRALADRRRPHRRPHHRLGGHRGQAFARLAWTRAARKVSEAVASPCRSARVAQLRLRTARRSRIGHGLQVGAERGREFAHVARELAPNSPKWPANAARRTRQIRPRTRRRARRRRTRSAEPNSPKSHASAAPNSPTLPSDAAANWPTSPVTAAPNSPTSPANAAPNWPTSPVTAHAELAELARERGANSPTTAQGANGRKKTIALASECCPQKIARH